MIPGTMKLHSAVSAAAIVACALLARLPIVFERRPWGDETFYALVGHQWLHGDAPYTIMMDMKAPGIFALFALFEAVLGDPLLAPRILHVIAVLATSLALWRIALQWFGDRPMGLIAALLYPPYSLTLGASHEYSGLLVAPFVAWGFFFAGHPQRGAPFAAGLLFGLAGTIKQIAVFDAAWALIIVLASQQLRAGSVVTRPVAFCLGAVAPFIVFTIYYAAIGHVDDLWTAMIVWALVRNDNYGSIVNAPVRVIAFLKSLLPLVVLSALAITERRWFRRRAEPAQFAWLAGWFGAALAGVIVQHALYGHYLLTLLPPLVLGAGLFMAELARRATWFRGVFRVAALGALIIFPVAWAMLMDWPSGDRNVFAVADRLHQLGLVRGTRAAELFVVDHETSLYLLTDTVQPTRFAHPEHLQCNISLPPGVDPVAEIEATMARRPRFVVITERRSRLACTLPHRMAIYMRHLDADYVLAGRVGDPPDAVEIYRRRTAAP